MIPKALRVGFEHIDASIYYGNEPETGAVLSKVPRSSYFLTSKIDPKAWWTADSAYAETTEQLDVVLSDLRVSFVDLVLVHWPLQRGVTATTPLTNSSCASIRESWRAMEDYYMAGKLRAIGVSNYCPSSLKCLRASWRVKPAINQVRYHVGMGPDHGGIRSYCEKLGITVQAYSPLGAGVTGKPTIPELISGDFVSAIGSKYGKSGAQVSLRWLAQQGMPVATQSTSEKHLASNLDIFDFELDDEDMTKLNEATSPHSPFGYSFMCNV